MKKSEIDLVKKYLFELCEIRPYCVDAWTVYTNYLFESNDLVTAELAYEHILSINPLF